MALPISIAAVTGAILGETVDRYRTRQTYTGDREPVPRTRPTTKHEHTFNQAPTPVPTPEPARNPNVNTRPDPMRSAHRRPTMPEDIKEQTPRQKEDDPSTGGASAYEDKVAEYKAYMEKMATLDFAEKLAQAEAGSDPSTQTHNDEQQTSINAPPGSRQIPNPLGMSSQGDYTGGAHVHSVAPTGVGYKRKVDRARLAHQAAFNSYTGGDNVALVQLGIASYVNDMNQYNVIFQ